LQNVSLLEALHMIQIKDTIVSTELLEERFVCDLTACKGVCCVEGDSGAPLLEEELEKLNDEFESVKPYLSAGGKQALEENGLYEKDADGDWVTTLREGKECAYTVFDQDNNAMCGMELAWKDGKTSFRKPISCHLYPVRVKRYEEFEAVNYERWHICSAACALGEALQVRVYEFLEEPLKRRFGNEWYLELHTVAEEWKKQKG